MWAQRTLLILCVILIFIYYKCFVYLFIVFFFILGYFWIDILQKVSYFLCKLCLFVCFIFLTTLKYHSNKFSELKPKDEVTLLSPGVLFWLILECSKLQFFPLISMGAHFWPKYKIKEFYFHPLNIVELSKKEIVCSGGKLRKSSQVLYFFLNKSKLFCPHLSRIRF